MSEPARDDNAHDVDDDPPVDGDGNGDFAVEHASLTVDDSPLDEPAEPDATP